MAAKDHHKDKARGVGFGHMFAVQRGIVALVTVFAGRKQAKTMTNPTHGLPVQGEPDPTFGRSYAVRGEVVPTLRLPAGWWIVPAVMTGTAGWLALVLAVMF